MQTLIKKIRAAKKEDPSFIFNMLPAALSNVPFHKDEKSITRYFAENFPVHLAVHKVSYVLAAPAEYTEPHVHDDHDEINIIISQQNLQYKIQLGKEEHIVGSNSCIWIPRGMLHAANVIKGSGYFVAMRMN
jgi:quercetin dioxygenase-like cupin family protein